MTVVVIVLAIAMVIAVKVAFRLAKKKGGCETPKVHGQTHVVELVQ